MNKDPSSYANPFPDCIRLPGHFSGSCGNCKWRDHAAKCSKRDESNTWVPAPERVTDAAAQTSAQTSTLPAAESPDDVPIVISEDESSVVSELAPCDNEEAIPPADNDGGDLDPKPEPHDDDDNEMDLVPIVDNGLAGDGTAENPLQID
ncbi:hypothetical protein CEP52_015216 [Fusarium oligoseptatum]|uniref:Uncharacterized protein n=2 Tax=Fusarium solani species complex TaxID=232080 RepID=A0A428SF71_9HYPO|nr:hypothetical protein CEP52_015216 [Fusarium oligoseptatum]